MLRTCHETHLSLKTAAKRDHGLGAFFQISMVGGLVLASPWVVYQLWGFVAPGLYPDEKRLVFRSVPLFVELFVIGVLFGWLVALPSSLDFMIRFNQGAGLQHQIAVSSWATFVVFPTAFGVAFELPLAMVVLCKIGLATGRTLRKHRKVAIVISAIVSAVLTPSPSPLDMLLMLVPLIVLYEAGLASVWLVERRPQSCAAAPPRAGSSDDLFASFLLPLLAAGLGRRLEFENSPINRRARQKLVLRLDDPKTFENPGLASSRKSFVPKARYLH
jgi:Tat protein translocase TatC